jgi:hypothetical protein
MDEAQNDNNVNTSNKSKKNKNKKNKNKNQGAVVEPEVDTNDVNNKSKVILFIIS